MEITYSFDELRTGKKVMLKNVYGHINHIHSSITSIRITVYFDENGYVQNLKIDVNII